MANSNRVEVINKFGWRKEFELTKPIIQIGRDLRNDIVLDDGHESGVVARHAQLLPSSVNRQGMRLINLSDRVIQHIPGGAASLVNGQTAEPSTALNGNGASPNGTAVREAVIGTAIAARSSAEIAGGDAIKIGEFTLIFHGGEQRSGVLKLEIETSGTQLTVDKPLTGNLTIRHIGNQPAVQFKVEFSGIDPEFIEIGPGPVLFPNAERKLPFTITHPRRSNPPAGKQRVTFFVSAPDAYPTERASIAVDLEIAPFFRHRVRLVVIDSPDFRLVK